MLTDSWGGAPGGKPHGIAFGGSAPDPFGFQLVQESQQILGPEAFVRAGQGQLRSLAEIGVGLQDVDESGKFHVGYFFSVDGFSEVFFFPNFFSRASLMSASLVLG